MEGYPNRRERRAHLKRMKWFKKRKSMTREERLEATHSNLELGNTIHSKNVEAIQNRIYEQLSAKEGKIQAKLNELKVPKEDQDRYLELWAANNMWPKDITATEYRELKKLSKKYKI